MASFAQKDLSKRNPIAKSLITARWGVPVLLGFSEPIEGVDAIFVIAAFFVSNDHFFYLSPQVASRIHPERQLKRSKNFLQMSFLV